MVTAPTKFKPIDNQLQKYQVRQTKQKIPVIGKFARTIAESKKRHRIVWGGRNKGASWQIAIYLLRMAAKRPMFIPCVREVQKSTEHSVKKILKETAERLKWDRFFKTTKSNITGKNGSEFIFLGLNEQTDDSIKSLENAQAAWVAEAQSISRASFSKFVPSIRGGKDAFIIWDLNPMRASDPVYNDLIVNGDEDEVDALYLTVLDNPFDLGVLNKDLIRDFKRDPKMAAHIWLGKLMPEGESAVFSVSSIENAMKNTLHPLESAPIVVGADIAHKGGDEIVFYKRQGLKVIAKEYHRRLSTPVCCRKLAAFSETPGVSKNKIMLNIDNGNVGAAVADLMEEANYRIKRIDFGGKADNEIHYANKITELYFELAEIMTYCDIPMDPELMDQLIDRRFEYVSGDKGEERMRLEPKLAYQKRKGKTNASPDRADGLVLCFRDALVLGSGVGFMGSKYY